MSVMSCLSVSDSYPCQWLPVQRLLHWVNCWLLRLGLEVSSEDIIPLLSKVVTDVHMNWQGEHRGRLGGL